MARFDLGSDRSESGRSCHRVSIEGSPQLRETAGHKDGSIQ